MMSTFRNWLEVRNVQSRAVVIARPAAGGDSSGWLLVPRGPARGVVVSVHGTGNDALYPQISLFKALLRRRYAVLAFDLDGHGRSSTALLGADTLKEAVPAALALVRDELPGLRVSLVGQSLGGALALQAAAARPKGLVSVVLISVPLELTMGRMRLAPELRSFAAVAFARQMATYGPWGMLPAAGPFKRRRFPVRLASGGGMFANYLTTVAGILNGMQLVEKVAPQVKVPVLCLNGTLDPIAPPTDGRALAEALPHGEFRELSGCGHLTAALALATERAVGEWLDDHHP